MSSRRFNKAELKAELHKRLVYLVNKESLLLTGNEINIERTCDDGLVERLRLSVGKSPNIRLAYFKDGVRHNDICLIPLSADNVNSGRKDYWRIDHVDLETVLDMVRRYMVLDELSGL